MAETATKKTTKRKKGAKTIAREYFDAISRQDLDAAGAMWKPGCVDHLHGVVDLDTPDGFRRWFSDLFNAFPDWNFEIVDIAASGDSAAVRWRVNATFSGPGRFQGIAPTGKRVEIEGCDMLTVSDGEIVDNHAYMNGIELAQQLGVMPPQGSVGDRAMTGLVNARTAATDTIRRFRERG